MLKYLVPLIFFGITIIFLGLGLSLNPKSIPSALINLPAPDFALPILSDPTKTLINSDLAGKVWLLNVWASWCVACRVEHPVLNRLAKKNLLVIVGLNYKDDPKNAKQWLEQLGNPYNVSVMDQNGRTGIDYGVYGVPETFIIDKLGIVRYKHIGPVSEKIITQLFLPLINQLKIKV